MSRKLTEWFCTRRTGFPLSLPSAGANHPSCANLRSSASLKPKLPGRRDRIVEYLADSMTRPDCPIDAADFGHFRLVGELFAPAEALQRIETAYEDKPQVRAEVILGLVVGCLDRLV